MADSLHRAYVSKPVGRSPAASSVAVSKSMRSNVASGTKPEVALAKYLRKRVKKNDLLGRPDFVYPKQKVAVFVHGCYWHRCPVDALPIPKTHTAFWRRKFERNVERDRLNREELESIGWNVIELWEHEVRSDPRACAERVLSRVHLSKRKVDSVYA
jgi:DNA mismatch endonuclease, patch repair protein